MIFEQFRLKHATFSHFSCNARWTGHFGCTIHSSDHRHPGVWSQSLNHHSNKHGCWVNFSSCASMHDGNINSFERRYTSPSFFIELLLLIFSSLSSSRIKTHMLQRDLQRRTRVRTQSVVCTITVAPQSPLIEEVSSLLNISSCLIFFIIYKKLRKENMR